VVWQPIVAPGLALLTGNRPDLRAFHVALAHEMVHTRSGVVLWCDGDHGFDPYHFAEANLTNGLEADLGAERLLIKRCMTPFQWHTVLTRHLDSKLVEVEASLVLVAPYDRLHSTDELADWEQEDHVRHTLIHLRSLTRRLKIPIVLSVDMARWWRTHPILAGLTAQAVDTRWTVTRPNGRFRVEGEGQAIDPLLRRQVTLLDFLPEAPAIPLVVPYACTPGK
jgi:hypothetical protein